jgi:hypothetical protein
MKSNPQKKGRVYNSPQSGPDTTRLTLRERRFLFAYLLSGNATQSYMAVILQVGSKEERAHQSGYRILSGIKRKISWPSLLERVDTGALNLVRELEADLTARRTTEGDGAAVLLAELLRARANRAGFVSNCMQVESKRDEFETISQTTKGDPE